MDWRRLEVRLRLQAAPPTEKSTRDTPKSHRETLLARPCLIAGPIVGGEQYGPDGFPGEMLATERRPVSTVNGR